MKLKIDEKADALYLRLDDSKIIESSEVSPGVVLDFNGENQVVWSGNPASFQAVAKIEPSRSTVTNGIILSPV